MHSAQPPLNALKAFEATARHLSFTLAAVEMNVTPGALSHQIRGLEEFLRVKLFERRTRSMPRRFGAFAEEPRQRRNRPQFGRQSMVFRLGAGDANHPDFCFVGNLGFMRTVICI